MRQYVRVKLNNPKQIFVDNSEADQQVLSGPGVKVVRLTTFIAKLIYQEDIILENITVNDAVLSGVKIEDIDTADLVKFADIDMKGKMLPRPEIVDIAKAKFNEYLKQQFFSNGEDVVDVTPAEGNGG